MLLTTLHLPTIGQLWADFAERSDREGWPAARYLATLLEHELAERYQRRIQRHLQDAHLPAGKSFATFDFAAVPMINKSQITALAAGAPGSTKAPTCWRSVHPASANRISPQPSARR